MNAHLELLKEFDLDRFYAVTLYKNSVTLQGYATKENVKYVDSLAVTLVFSQQNQWFQGWIKKEVMIEIVLVCP